MTTTIDSNTCVECGKPVGNPVFTCCDDCWPKPSIALPLTVWGNRQPPAPAALAAWVVELEEIASAVVDDFNGGHGATYTYDRIHALRRAVLEAVGEGGGDVTQGGTDGKG